MTKIKITHVPGEGTLCRATLKLEFDASDPEATERFALLMRELIPEEERAQFLEAFQAAGKKAGLEIKP